MEKYTYSIYRFYHLLSYCLAHSYKYDDYEAYLETAKCLNICTTWLSVQPHYSDDDIFIKYNIPEIHDIWKKSFRTNYFGTFTYGLDVNKNIMLHSMLNSSLTVKWKIDESEYYIICDMIRVCFDSMYYMINLNETYNYVKFNKIKEKIIFDEANKTMKIYYEWNILISFSQPIKLNAHDIMHHRLVTNDMGGTNFYLSDLVTDENIREYIFKHEEEAKKYMDTIYYNKLSDLEKMIHELGFNND